MRTWFKNANIWGLTGDEFWVEDGKFVSGGDGEVVDLAGKYVMPGFVDAHCHILPTGLDLLKLHLGKCQTKEQVLDAVRDEVGKGEGWLHAVHYDQTKFADAKHLSKDDLDAISTSRPILLRHSNGHASVANSAALIWASVDESTPDPAGGEYVRDASGRLTGVLLERAHEHVTDSAPRPTTEEMTLAILAAADKMSALGITAATDMMTGRWHLADEIDAYEAAANRGAKIRFRLCMQWARVFGPRGMGADAVRERLASLEESQVRPIGIKIFADGAIGSASAAIHGTFLTTGGNGQLIYAPDRLNAMVREAHEAGFAVATHAIGDRAVDLVMDAYEATGQPDRHRVEHAMILSDAQIDRLKRLGLHVTMQPEFLVRFGHAYRKQLPPETASRIKRFRSVLDAGIPLSFSSDRPIVPGNPWDGITCAVARPEGFDDSENIGLQKAIDLYTRQGALANGEPRSMGEITPGAWADFQVYDRLPAPISSPSAVYKGGVQVRP